MIELLIAGAIGFLIAWIVSSFAFKCHIEKQSKESKPVQAFGVNYWFMTQDQIQKAVKAVYLMEMKAYKNLDKWEKNENPG